MTGSPLGPGISRRHPPGEYLEPRPQPRHLALGVGAIRDRETCYP